ncbi:MAG: DMT family transporter [Syntrophothermus sp.]
MAGLFQQLGASVIDLGFLFSFSLFSEAGKKGYDMNWGTSVVLVLLNLIWGASYVAAKIGLQEMPPFTLAVVRFAVASVLMLPFLWKERKQAGIGFSEWPELAFIGLLGFTFTYVFQYAGMTMTTATNSALLLVAEPALIAVFAWIILREPFTLPKFAGLAAAMAGVILLSNIDYSQVSLLKNEVIWGNLLVFMSMAASAWFTIAGKNTLQRHSPLVVTTYALIFGTLFLVPFALFELRGHPLPAISWRGWGAVLYLAVLCTVVSYSAWYIILQHNEAGKMAVFLNLQPLVGVFLGVFYLHEQVNRYTVLGGLLIIAGVYLTTTARGAPAKSGRRGERAVAHESEKTIGG